MTTESLTFVINNSKNHSVDVVLLDDSTGKIKNSQEASVFVDKNQGDINKKLHAFAAGVNVEFIVFKISNVDSFQQINKSDFCGQQISYYQKDVKKWFPKTILVDPSSEDKKTCACELDYPENSVASSKSISNLLLLGIQPNSILRVVVFYK